MYSAMREPNGYPDTDDYIQEEKNTSDDYEVEIAENPETELDEE